MIRELTAAPSQSPPVLTLLPSGARDGTRGRAAFHYTRAAAERMRAGKRKLAALIKG